MLADLWPMFVVAAADPYDPQQWALDQAIHDAGNPSLVCSGHWPPSASAMAGYSPTSASGKARWRRAGTRKFCRQLELHADAVILRHREECGNIKLDARRDDVSTDARCGAKKKAPPLRVRRAPPPARPPV